MRNVKVGTRMNIEVDELIGREVITGGAQECRWIDERFNEVTYNTNDVQMQESRYNRGVI